MKYFRYIVLLIFVLQSAAVPAFRENPILFLVKEKARIDKLDGKLDGKIYLEDSARSEMAQQTYFVMVDSIWNALDYLDISEQQRDSLVFLLYFRLAKVQDKEIHSLEQDNRWIVNMWHILRGIAANNLSEVLKINTYMSLQQIAMYAFRPEAETFLMNVMRFYPDEVLKNFHQYQGRSWTEKVVESASSLAPSIAKKYIISDNPIDSILEKSQDSSVKAMMYITKKIGKNSDAYNLIDAVAKNELSAEAADSLTKQPFPYLKEMIRLRTQKHPFAEYSLDKGLEIEALKYVRKMNNLHNDNDKIRFADIENFSAEELYTLIVYSEEEIFTSTFNGTFSRLLKKLGTRNRYRLFDSLGFNRYRAFIKQCASFGKLEEFLSTMSADEQKKLMLLFVSGLDDDNINLGEAVEVADAYSGIKDSTLAAYIRKNIKNEYIRSQLNERKDGMAIYGLLASLFTGEKTFDSVWYSEIAAQYQIPEINLVKHENLFRQNSANIWQMYFYDDEDGAASFASFSAIFRNDRHWRIAEENDLYIKIRSADGAPVIIYANKPKAEYEGQAFVEQLLDSLKIQPDVLIHRGHSYYANKTIEKIKPSAQIFVLGSCGGYNNLSSIIQLAPDVSIISSKQIGVQGVNNPLLKLLADNIRSGADVSWETLWRKLDKQLKNTPSYIQFVDYIPPHKNIGAIFIRSYMKMMSGEGG